MRSACALRDAFDHARGLHPREACGVVVRVGGACRFLPVENVAPEPTTSFEFDPVAQLAIWRAARNGHHELLAVVHSHCDAPARFSLGDRVKALAADGRPLHPGLEHWVLSVGDAGSAASDAAGFTWEAGDWIERRLACAPAAGAPSCIAAPKGV